MLRSSSGGAALGRSRRDSVGKTLTAPLVGAAGQLPKLDLFFLFRRYLRTHGGGVQLDTKARRPLPPDSRTCGCSEAISVLRAPEAPLEH